MASKKRPRIKPTIAGPLSVAIVRKGAAVGETHLSFKDARMMRVRNPGGVMSLRRRVALLKEEDGA